MTLRYCPNGYRSRDAARSTAKKVRRPDGLLWRVYKCFHCELWHLGTDADAAHAVGGRLYATYSQRRRGRA